GLFPGGKTRVLLSAVGPMTYKFTVRRKIDGNTDIEAKGYIRGQMGLPTLIVGEARIPHLSIAGFLLFLFASVFIFAALGSAALCVNFAPFVFLFAGLWFYSGLTSASRMVEQRNELVREIEMTLLGR